MSINSKESSVRLRCFVRSMQSNRGFTLVELIVITAIIGVLATMSLLSISDFKEKTRVARASAEIRGLEKDVISFASDKGFYPPDVNAVGVEDLKNLLDPWGNNYVYFRIIDPLDVTANRNWVGQSINTDFDLYSKGPDKISTDTSIELGNSVDDIIRGGDGGFVGSSDKYGL